MHPEFPDNDPYSATMTEPSTTLAAPAPRGPSFRKMHGLGNDFVLLDLRRQPRAALPSAALVRALADRRTGVGFDQLIGILPAAGTADAVLRFWNADGSEAGACGNGTRCAAWILLQERNQTAITLRTPRGRLHAQGHNDCRDEITVDLGRPLLDWQDIPLSEPRDTRAFEAPAGAAEVAKTASAVSMGNPHCILFTTNPDRAPVARVGAALETDPLFPERVNVSFAEMRSRDRIRLRVWERGVGETRACASAACATLVAGVRLGLAERRAVIELAGGVLQVHWPKDDAPVSLRGPVASVFEGTLDPEFASALTPRGGATS